MSATNRWSTALPRAFSEVVTIKTDWRFASPNAAIWQREYRTAHYDYATAALACKWRGMWWLWVTAVLVLSHPDRPQML